MSLRTGDFWQFFVRRTSSKDPVSRQTCLSNSRRNPTLWLAPREVRNDSERITRYAEIMPLLCRQWTLGGVYGNFPGGRRSGGMKSALTPFHNRYRKLGNFRLADGSGIPAFVRNLLQYRT